MAKTKSREKVIDVLKLMRQGKLTQALMELSEYADTHVRNERTAEALRRAISHETHEITAHEDPYAEETLIKFEGWDK